MMLPILISVSVAPGSYFFWAVAELATATANSPASAADVAKDLAVDLATGLTRLKAWQCIIVLPEVLAAAHAVFIVGQLGEPSDSMQERSMHDWDYVTSAAFGRNFRTMEQTQDGLTKISWRKVSRRRVQRQSNEAHCKPS
jgi:hypothetical protein